jgi:hypothetical protein
MFMFWGINRDTTRLSARSAESWHVERALTTFPNIPEIKSDSQAIWLRP